MTKYAQVLAAVTLFLGNVSNAEQLRGKDPMDMLKQRLDALDMIVKKHDADLLRLEESIEKHVDIIPGFHNSRRLDGSPSCELVYEDGYCVLMKRVPGGATEAITAAEEEPETTVATTTAEGEDSTTSDDDGGRRKLQGDLMAPADFVVRGRTLLEDGLEVEAGDCDNCIYFADDVIFDDNVKFVDPVVFEDPVTFKQDITIVGPEVPSSVSKLRTSDTTYSSLDFVFKEYGKAKFDHDKRFVVTPVSRFEKTVDVKLPSSPSSDATAPNLIVEGNLNVGGAIA